MKLIAAVLLACFVTLSYAGVLSDSFNPLHKQGGQCSKELKYIQDGIHGLQAKFDVFGQHLGSIIDKSSLKEETKNASLAQYVYYGLYNTSKRVPKTEYAAYYDQAIANNWFKQQYESIPEGQYYKWDTGRTSVNFPARHRYDFSKAYDYNRVVLKVLPGETPYDDYINANYINGYRAHYKFIATQAPIPATVNHHWRMILDSGANQIVTLTRLVENGKTKSEKYWPEEGYQNYGDIKVEFIDKKEYPELIVRQFRVTRYGESRIVTHYHYLGWPDNGTPATPNNLYKIYQLTNEIYEKDPVHPIAVHCSAGVGRTGTFILYYNMLDMAKYSDYLDIYKYFAELRAQRVNALETLDQYVFVHKALKDKLAGVY